MLETLLITFREGLEAFLIVAITLAYIIKTKRYYFVPAVKAGVVVALLLSATAGYHISTLAQNPVMEGTLALIAGGLVASMTLYVMKNARHFRGDIHQRIDREAEKNSAIAMIGIFAFTVLMISREGMETALMLGSIAGQMHATEMFAGAAAGLGLTGLIGYLWVKQSDKINLRLFLQVTGIFLVIFSLHLFVYGIHELSEMDLLPFVDNYPIHIATEPFAHGHIVAQIITYSLVAVPCIWLAFSFVRDRVFHAQAAE